MALTETSLAAACGASDLTLSITSTTGAVVGNPLKIDNEYIGGIVAFTTAATGNCVVRGRGSEGTAAVSHNTLAPVTFCAVSSDFPALTPGQSTPVPFFVPALVSYSTSGAIAVPTKDTVAQVTDASAAALTLAVPSKASDNVRLTLTSMSSAAHTINAASTSPGAIFNTGVTGGPWYTVTFPAYIGGGLTLMAAQGVWNLVGNTACTFS